jgi:regulator of PEP synthase PpsR (kinase-PPPase family)
MPGRNTGDGDQTDAIAMAPSRAQTTPLPPYIATPVAAIASSPHIASPGSIRFAEEVAAVNCRNSMRMDVRSRGASEAQ